MAQISADLPSKAIVSTEIGDEAVRDAPEFLSRRLRQAGAAGADEGKERT